MTWLAGSVLTASLYNDEHTATTYVPVLTATATNPTLGSGSSATGRYARAGQLVTVQGRILFGTSGVAAGSGNYQISLPFTANFLTGVINLNGEALLSDASSGNFVRAYLAPVGGGALVQMRYTTSAGVSALAAVSNTAPWTWAASDYISFSFSYETSV